MEEVKETAVAEETPAPTPAQAQESSVQELTDKVHNVESATAKIRTLKAARAPADDCDTVESHSCLSIFAVMSSRNRFLSILLTLVLGNASSHSRRSGHLYLATPSRVRWS